MSAHPSIAPFQRTFKIRCAKSPTSTSCAIWSFRLDAGRPNDRPPFLQLGAVQRSERLRRLLLARDDLIAEIGHALLDRGVTWGVDDGGIEPGDDGRRRILRRP